MKLINGRYLDLTLQMTPDLTTHFNDPFNYTKEIMAQFDADYYKDIVPKKKNVILDIGANVGLFALHVLPYTSEIVCVEPTPSHFKKLQDLTPFAHHENSALAGHDGEVTFYTCGINTTMNSLHKRDTAIKVPCLTLKSLMDKYNTPVADFCKIDIEGSEDVAVTEKILKEVDGRLRRVFIELHPPNAESQTRFQKIFEACGYKVQRFVHDSLICDYGLKN